MLKLSILDNRAAIEGLNDFSNRNKSASNKMHGKGYILQYCVLLHTSSKYDPFCTANTKPPRPAIFPPSAIGLYLVLHSHAGWVNCFHD